MRRKDEEEVMIMRGTSYERGEGEEEEREEKDRYYLRGFSYVDIAQCQALALNIVGWYTIM